MPHAQSGGVSTVAHGDQFLTAAASLVVGGAFFASWFWLLPQWLGFRVDTTGTARWRWLAALPSVLGFAFALRCVWDFGWTGHGTPAPFAPPQRLVAVGLYRHVRNPMYLGFAVGWSGLWVIFGHANPAAIAGVAAVALAIYLFVVFYRRAHSARQIRGRLRTVLRERGSMVAARARLGQAAIVIGLGQSAR